MEQYQIASDGLAVEIPKLRKLMETDIKALEKQLDAAESAHSRPLARLEEVTWKIVFIHWRVSCFMQCRRKKRCFIGPWFFW